MSRRGKRVIDREVFAAGLREGQRLADIAPTLGVAPRTLTSRLQPSHAAYDKDLHEWYKEMRASLATPWDADAACEMLAQGYKYDEIADRFQISKRTLHERLKDDPQAVIARAVRAQTFAEDHAEKILEDAAKEGAKLTAAQAAIARERSQLKRWLAGKIDPKYSDRPQVNIGVDMGDFGKLFTEMLKEHGTPKLPAEELPRAEIPPADYEIVTEDEDA